MPGYECERVDMLPRTDTGKRRTSYFLVPCGDGVPLIPRKIYNIINVKVELGEGEDKISLDAIAERAKKYQPKPKVT